jgi:hypothetical protein
MFTCLSLNKSLDSLVRKVVKERKIMVRFRARKYIWILRTDVSNGNGEYLSRDKSARIMILAYHLNIFMAWCLNPTPLLLTFKL